MAFTKYILQLDIDFIQFTRQMNRILFLALFLLTISTLQRSTCLLDDPVTDQCLQSLQVNSIDKELLKYLCVIASERSLLDKAEDFCREASTVDLDAGYRYFRVLLRRGKYEEAFRIEYNLFFVSPFSHNSELTRILSEQRQNLSQESVPSQSSFNKAIFYFYSNQTQKSLDELNKHLQANKQNNEMIYEHFLMARVLEKQYQYYDGMNYIAKIVKTNKKLHPYLWHLNGNFLMHHVQFEKAIKQFERANIEFHNLYKANGFSFSNYNIGLCYEKLGKLDEAIKYYEKSVINLNSAEALNALGHAYYSKYESSQDSKKLELAEGYYKSALKVDDQYTVAIFNLGMLSLTQKKSQQAIEYFDQCLNMEQTFRSCKLGLIKSYYMARRPQEAWKIIEAIQQNEDILAELLAILYELGDHKAALRLTGEKEDFKSALLMEWKGFNEYALDQFQKAARSFGRAVFLGAKKAYIYFSLGLAQLELKEYEACFNSFRTANQMEPRAETKQKMEECQKLLNNDL